MTLQHKSNSIFLGGQNMTIEQMAAVGEIGRILIYNPFTYTFIFTIFLYNITGGHDEL